MRRRMKYKDEHLLICSLLNDAFTVTQDDTTSNETKTVYKDDVWERMWKEAAVA
jgi:hypothetical protein